MEESEILAAHADLLDADFLQTLLAVAEMGSQQEDENTANRLRNQAIHLSQVLNLPSPVVAEQNLQSAGTAIALK